MARFFKTNDRAQTPAEIGLARERRMKTRKIMRIFLVLWLILGSIAIVYMVADFVRDYEFRSPIVKKIVSPIPEEDIVKPEPKKKQQSKSSRIIREVVADTTEPSDALYFGKVSHYSHAGCLGCHEEQLMGNGVRFDENKMTLAVPCEDVINKRISYNTRVRVINVDNGYSVEGVITDCGGFSKYNRVADLSLGMSRVLETKTDISNVKIVLL